MCMPKKSHANERKQHLSWPLERPAFYGQWNTYECGSVCRVEKQLKQLLIWNFKHIWMETSVYNMWMSFVSPTSEAISNGGFRIKGNGWFLCNPHQCKGLNGPHRTTVYWSLLCTTWPPCFQANNNHHDLYSSQKPRYFTGKVPRRESIPRALTLGQMIKNLGKKSRL